jgi:hypothetical protein
MVTSFLSTQHRSAALKKVRIGGETEIEIEIEIGSEMATGQCLCYLMYRECESIHSLLMDR